MYMSTDLIDLDFRECGNMDVLKSIEG